MKNLKTILGTALVAICVVVAGIGSYQSHNFSVQEKAPSELHEVPETIVRIEYIEVPSEIIEVQEEIEFTEVPLIRTSAYVNLTFEEMDLLEHIAMAEAEGEDTIGKALVMITVLNRSRHDGKSIYDVIYRQGQFATHRMYIEPTEDCHEALAMVMDGWNEKEIEFENGLEEYIPIRWFSADGYPIYGQRCFKYGGHYFSGM